jgi:hypothetical protein
VVRGALALLATAAATAAGGTPPPSSPAPAPSAAAPPADWRNHEMPLPISVRSPQDLAFKAEAERQYLIFNLMAEGRLAYEAGDFARAAREWETLLRVPSLPVEVSRAVSPLLLEVQRQRAAAGLAPEPPPARPAAASSADRAPAAPPAAVEPPPGVTVAGAVTGGGAIGPGGAVLWLKRLDGPTPPPRTFLRPRLVSQSGKTFAPHVLAVPIGQTVDFRNDDPFFHNVFSLSDGQHFDAGLYGAGRSYTKTFTHAGPVELLCNIHASMMGYLYIVDSAYYAQPRPSGAFTIRNVPPGRYELSAWHESSASVVKQTVTVGAGGVRGLAVRIPGDRAPLVAVPDKYGKPRQPQLGY